MRTERRDTSQEGDGSSGRVQLHSPRRAHRLRVATAVAALAFLGLGLTGTKPALAADSTIPPYVAGQHIYGAGTGLSKAGAARAESGEISANKRLSSAALPSFRKSRRDRLPINIAHPLPIYPKNIEEPQSEIEPIML